MADFADLLRIGAVNTGGGGGGGSHGHVLGILPALHQGGWGFSIQGLSFLDKPICQSSVIAGCVFNTPTGKPGQQNIFQKLAASLREDFAKVGQDGHAKLMEAVQAGHQLLAQGAQAASGQISSAISSGLGAIGLSTGGHELF